MKTALTIGGSDSCGGAGIQADLKVFSVLGVYGMSAITAVTAQNTMGVKDVAPMTAALVRQQIDTVASDIQVDACKTGMLAGSELVEAVAASIRDNKLARYVCDPTMFSKSGARLLKEDAIGVMRKQLFPLASVITPNRREAAALTGVDVEQLSSVAAGKDAAKRIVQQGAKSVVVKGLPSDGQVVDLFYDGKEFLEFAAGQQPTEKTHGSGCAFSAAITAGLANGLELIAAIDQAKQLVTMAIQYSDGQGRGVAPVNVLAFGAKKK